MAKKDRLAVFGAGGHGRVVADAAEACGWNNVDFFDDAVTSTAHGPWQVRGTFRCLDERLDEYAGVIVAIGHNRRRLALHDELAARGAALVSVVHPQAVVSPYAVLEPGTFIAPGAVVCVGTVIRRGAIVNTGATVDHDCTIGPGAHIAPGVAMSGGVTVGECSWVGVGAAVKELVEIGTDCMVGAGSVVIRSVDSGVTVVGNPARPLNKD
ncbi:acetyltransferase [Pseudorhizobium halotolerans]|uniref:Acetyltransferase n=1 Tax=Pseudorhizobium halotolerans TaxID=1233081 RepID=A0ABN7JYF3_9HYPH|nr:acetyltransferase [Pseudorhizobium halotolerans]CAD7050761.1 acetyltransferase [Pseudorhizobium halotolerans]